MRKFEKINGKTIPLCMNDVDTDLIIPAQYLTSVSKQGYGQHLFRRLRERDPQFVFNLNQFADASILITQHNFGCGSSREHAVWALQEAGIQAIIAVSFADIFFTNSGKNGLLLMTQPENIIQQLIHQSISSDYYLTIDIKQQIITDDKQTQYHFKLDPFYQYCLLNGLDDLDYLLKQQNKILHFKQQQEINAWQH